jgi:hypothetical protein
MKGKRGWFGESRRHSLSARGIRTNWGGIRYDLRLRDIDQDGVPDKFDCQPKNPKKQGLLHDGIKAGERLEWWVTLIGVPILPASNYKAWNRKLSRYPYSPDRNKNGVSDALEGEVKVSKKAKHI